MGQLGAVKSWKLMKKELLFRLTKGRTVLLKRKCNHCLKKHKVYELSRMRESASTPYKQNPDIITLLSCKLDVQEVWQKLFDLWSVGGLCIKNSANKSVLNVPWIYVVDLLL
nr:hypothetical protein [Tanacetum cinerariifolium]